MLEITYGIDCHAILAFGMTKLFVLWLSKEICREGVWELVIKTNFAFICGPRGEFLTLTGASCELCGGATFQIQEYRHVDHLCQVGDNYQFIVHSNMLLASQLKFESWLLIFVFSLFIFLASFTNIISCIGKFDATTSLSGENVEFECELDTHHTYRPMFNTLRIW